MCSHWLVLLLLRGGVAGIRCAGRLLQPGAEFVGVLAEPGWPPVVRRLGCRTGSIGLATRSTRVRGRRRPVMRAPRPRSAARAKASARSLTGPQGTPMRRQHLEPVVGGVACGHCAVMVLVEGVDVGDAGGVGREPGIGRCLGNAKGGAEVGELPVVADRDDDGPVGGREQLVGRDRGVPVAQDAGDRAARRCSRRPG